MADRVVEEFKKLSEFRDLISATIAALQGAATATALVRAIDDRIAGWEKADPDFASVLREVKGQAYSLQPQHLKAVANKVCEHLRVNLDRIEKGLRKA
ncbi:MAG: hypothetical protein FJ087_03145 [Deltaproteobacteria bacterium]|nr:hypothetical protein [Deltaproteobacteria bacterium]